MGKPVLFLIHGIGVHSDDWSDAITAMLGEISSRYPSMGTQDIVKQIDIVPLKYDDVFDKVLQRWNEEISGLKKLAVYDQVRAAVDWLDGSTKGGFVWTYVGDLILFQSQAIRNTVVSKLVAEMAATIAKRNDGSTSFNVLAHSMGTAVAMEALHSLATPNAEIKWKGLPPGLLFDNVMMIANTSRLLQRPGLRAYEDSRVLPKSVKPGGLCLNYWNLSHALDPVTAVRRFNLQPAVTQGYVSREVDHFYDRNIHSLRHYLEHPLVHGVLLRLPAAKNLPFTAWQSAVKEYHDDTKKRFGGAFSKVQEVLQFRENLRSVLQPDPEHGSFLDHIKYIAASLKEML